MLAQNFKSAEALDLSGEQHAALVKVLGLLEREELTHVTEVRLTGFCSAKTFTGHFNMNVWRETADCGTVACIGGTAELVGRCQFDWPVADSPLFRLFHPPRMHDRTTAEAATALRSYLTTGEAEWS